MLSTVLAKETTGFKARDHEWCTLYTTQNTFFLLGMLSDIILVIL